LVIVRIRNLFRLYNLIILLYVCFVCFVTFSKLLLYAVKCINKNMFTMIYTIMKRMLVCYAFTIYLHCHCFKIYILRIIYKKKKRKPSFVSLISTHNVIITQYHLQIPFAELVRILRKFTGNRSRALIVLYYSR